LGPKSALPLGFGASTILVLGQSKQNLALISMGPSLGDSGIDPPISRSLPSFQEEQKKNITIYGSSSAMLKRLE